MDERVNRIYKNGYSRRYLRVTGKHLGWIANMIWICINDMIWQCSGYANQDQSPQMNLVGWFMSWKIPVKNGWWLGVPLWRNGNLHINMLIFQRPAAPTIIYQFSILEAQRDAVHQISAAHLVRIWKKKRSFAMYHAWLTWPLDTHKLSHIISLSTRCQFPTKKNSTWNQSPSAVTRQPFTTRPGPFPRACFFFHRPRVRHGFITDDQGPAADFALIFGKDHNLWSHNYVYMWFYVCNCVYM